MSRTLDDLDRRIVLETQAGLPLVPRPYHVIAERVGSEASIVMARIRCMLQDGIIRRIGVVPNHYALGFRANGMTVWDVTDEDVDALGMEVGALPFVSHCYRRPRRLPVWTYNLFAMVHGKTRTEVEDKAEMISARLGTACRGHEILYSTRILKKTGLRLAG